MEKIFFKSLALVAESIRKREISPVELTSQVLERIEALEPILNAFILVLKEEALQQAEALAEELERGKIRGPLHGVPIAIKDIFETIDSVTTSGSKLFENWQSNQDAVIVQKLKEAGAIIIGKTNLHEFAMGSTTDNPHYGPTRNPWNINKIPGGSSGGSAAAVAAGMCFGAIGTDTGGSIRLPAALCGIVGLKPTYDLVSRKGCTTLSWSFDHIGPMTRTVKDSAIILESIAKPEELAKIDLNLEGDIKGLKIGIQSEYFFENMDTEMEMVIKQAISKLESLGAEIVEVSIPGVYEALEGQKVISKSEAYTFHQEMFTNFPEKYGEDSQARLNSAKTIMASEYLNAQRLRKQFIENTLDTMKSCDVLLSPTNVIEAFDIGSMPPEESVNNIFNLGRTPIGNLLGFPALTVPCGFTSKNLPVGMQLIGKPYADGLLLKVGNVYEKSEKWVERLASNEVYETEINIG
jgi:aspartyl-tRNA(Asn)/glutamyl-tRNA(Gln) amidotransferase subunit A